MEIVVVGNSFFFKLDLKGIANKFKGRVRFEKLEDGSTQANLFIPLVADGLKAMEMARNLRYKVLASK